MSRKSRREIPDAMALALQEEGGWTMCHAWGTSGTGPCEGRPFWYEARSDTATLVLHEGERPPHPAAVRGIQTGKIYALVPSGAPGPVEE